MRIATIDRPSIGMDQRHEPQPPPRGGRRTDSTDGGRGLITAVLITGLALGVLLWGVPNAGNGDPVALLAPASLSDSPASMHH